jgi:NhaP-type Na+/H+ or K+/H+ antiporter
MGIDIFASYNLIIESCVIIIFSFFFGEISKKTNIPSVLLLIILGIGLGLILKEMKEDKLEFLPYLEILGTIGLIMIVLEAALELKLSRQTMIPLIKSFIIALIGLIASAVAAVYIIKYFNSELTDLQAWLYATPISILSSAIIIPSVSGLVKNKKEFHVYESTFSDILGIMLFYFLASNFENNGEASAIAYTGNIILTIVLSIIVSYLLVLIFQNIKSHVILFLLIATLILVYAVGKKMHLSSLIIILVFGLMISNLKLFFGGKLQSWLKSDKMEEIYEGLHVITMETAFVVRTFFFVIFGITIDLSTLANLNVFWIALLVMVSIYLIRFILLRAFIGKDIIPQVFIAPRGLITVLLFFAIPEAARLESFEQGIIMYVIIGTSLIMTGGMIYDKQRTNATLGKIKSKKVDLTRWKAPSYE